MKKLILIIITSILLAGCQKKQENKEYTVKHYQINQEYVFIITNKSTNIYNFSLKYNNKQIGKTIKNLSMDNYSIITISSKNIKIDDIKIQANKVEKVINYPNYNSSINKNIGERLIENKIELLEKPNNYYIETIGLYYRDKKLIGYLDDQYKITKQSFTKRYQIKVDADDTEVVNRIYSM